MKTLLNNVPLFQKCVVTCFFIYLVQTTHRILKHGVIWLNLGPLIYHFSDMKGEDSIKSDYQNVNAIIQDEYSYHYIRFTAKKKQVGKRGASLQSLDQRTLARLLTKKYSLLVCMAPLTHQIRVLGSSALCPPILGTEIS